MPGQDGAKHRPPSFKSFSLIKSPTISISLAGDGRLSIASARVAANFVANSATSPTSFSTSLKTALSHGTRCYVSTLRMQGYQSGAEALAKLPLCWSGGAHFMLAPRSVKIPVTEFAAFSASFFTV